MGAVFTWVTLSFIRPAGVEIAVATYASGCPEGADMHSRLAAALAHADAARAALFAAVDEVPEPLREARASEDTWSVAEIIEHLARTETGIAKLFALRIGEMQAQASPPREAPEFIAITNPAFALAENPTRKLAAPERIQPRGEMSADEARAKLVQSRGMLLDQLHAGEGLAYSTILHPHPYFGDLNVYEWVHFLGSHEIRHTAQIREVGAKLAAQ
jgi:uncharacterized damage-inducible protein DinB